MIYFYMLLVLPTLLFGAQTQNEMTRVFYHQSHMSDKLVCYFTQDPVCNRLPSKSKEGSESKAVMQFFMPMTVETAEAKTMIKKIQAQKKPYYSVTFDEVTKPIKGVALTIQYNPQKIVCNYEAFDAINTHKGVIFSFHNKDLLQTLKLKTDSLLQCAYASSSKKPCIILDYGHGGSDTGKVSCFGNVKEKDITLAVGQKVGKILQQRGYEVLATRTKDDFVPLDERTNFANKKNADVFISIHANSAAKSDVQGIETYWMNYDLFKSCMSLTDAHVAETLKALKHRYSIASQSLAKCIHEHALKETQKEHAVIDRKVRQSVAQVLLGTTIPAVIIEMGYLSNPYETKLLTNHNYQHKIAQGIAAGIIAFLNVRNQA